MSASAPSTTEDPEVELTKQLRHARQLLRDGQLNLASTVCHDLYDRLGHRDHELSALLGLIHHGQGDLESAGRFFAEAIQALPDNPLFHYNHGVVLLQQGDRQAATLAMQKAVRLQPDLGGAHLALGNIAMQDNRPDEAIVHYAAALTTADCDPKAAYSNLALAYRRLGVWQAAVKILDQAASILPRDASIARELGDLLLEHNRPREAVQAYARALTIAPETPSLLERMGDLMVALDSHVEAIRFYREVLRLQPGNSKVLNNLGLVLHNQGLHADAIAVYGVALTRDEHFPEAHYNLANALMVSGNRVKAISHYQEAIRWRPEYLEAWYNLGVALQKETRYAEAEEAYRRVLSLEQSNPTAWFNLALVQQAQHRLDDAIGSYGRALELDPDFALGWYNLGIALNESGRHADAVASFRTAHHLVPADVKVLNNWGLALFDLERLEEAVAVFRQAIGLQPDFADAHANLGNVYLLQGHATDALAAYNRAVEYDPTFAKAYYNLGCLFMQRNQTELAIANYRKAIALDPDLVEAHWNLSNALLVSGALTEGFSEYRWRWRRKGADALLLPLPEWKGEYRPEATLLIVTEQGKGDSLQIIRFLPRIRPLVGRIVLACEVSLQALMASVPEIDQVVFKQEIPAYCAVADCYLPLLNLPAILNLTHLAEVTPQGPYLHPDPERVQAFAGLFCDCAAQLKVGVVWRGNPSHRNDHNRSCLPQHLAPLMALPGIQIFSLQKAARPDDFLPGVVDLAPHLDSFADTAAIMVHLDLIISVDTAVAHLAGALGKEVWVMLPFVPDWRWMLDRDDTPWYPTMRLFRQSAAKNWDQVVRTVCDCLSSADGNATRTPHSFYPGAPPKRSVGMACASKE